MTMDYNKTFKFSKLLEWNLRDLEQMLSKQSSTSQDKQMMSMKSSLNELKETLSIYNIGEWSRHTTRMNPASKVVKTVGSTIKPRPFCSNAWCKFYELLETLRLLDDLDLTSPLHSVHLCEAPGGFICALNHYVQSGLRGLEHEWLANTLNPYHEKCKLGEMVPDDRLIRHTLDRWLFGGDNTGDLTNLDNIDHIIEQAKDNLGSKVQLVTADGSLDCQLSPSDQEMIVYPLILCELYTVISLLAGGGVAVLKMFTMYESHTISVMYLLNLLFKTVHIHKPVTSKPGNSEVYVVCKGRVETVPQLVLETLRSAISSGKPIFSLESIPETFLQQIRVAAEQFKDRQMDTISRNVSAFNINKLIPSISNEKNAQDFIRQMRLESIKPNQCIVQAASFYTHQGHHSKKDDLTINSYGNESRSLVWQPRKRRLSGNFSERSQITSENRLTELLASDLQPTQTVKFLYTMETSCPHNHSPIDALHVIQPVIIPSVRVSSGAAADTPPGTAADVPPDDGDTDSPHHPAAPPSDNRIYNSCFCEGKLLSDYNVLTDHRRDVLNQVARESDLKDIEQFVISKLDEFHIVCQLNATNEISEDYIGEVSSHRLFVISDVLSDLRSFISLFEVICSDDSLLLHNIDCISRLGAGLVFLLWHCFDEVAIVGHNAANHRPSLLFKRCLLSQQERVEYSESLKHNLLPYLTQNVKVLTVVPTPTIIKCTTLHSSFLCDVNNETLRRSINSMMGDT